MNDNDKEFSKFRKERIKNMTEEDKAYSKSLQNKYLAAEEIKTKKNSMGVYCKCGKIIFAVTCEHLKIDKEAQRDLMKYIADGYRTENVSKEQVKELFGCDCT